MSGGVLEVMGGAANWLALEGLDRGAQELREARDTMAKLQLEASPFVDYPEDFFEVEDDQPVTITVLGRNLKGLRSVLARANGSDGRKG